MIFRIYFIKTLLRIFFFILLNYYGCLIKTLLIKQNGRKLERKEEEYCAPLGMATGRVRDGSPPSQPRPVYQK